MTEQSKPAAPSPFQASSPLVDLGLTLPLFVAYHLGVAFLPVRNAADWVTSKLVELADHNLAAYGGLTLAIGILFAGFLTLAGRGEVLKWERFVVIALEGALYAFTMRLAASYVVGRMALGPPELAGVFPGLVMSIGAGFYEEIAFRVGLFGLGAKLLGMMLPLTGLSKVLLTLGWALAAAAVFSGWHYFGVFGDAFELRSFVFRWVCGCVFTAIYVFRGFAPAVWTHALYDIWVLVL